MTSSRSLFEQAKRHLESLGFMLSHDGQNWGFLLGSIGFFRPGKFPGMFELVTVVRRQESIQLFLRLSAVPTGNRWRGLVTNVPFNSDEHAPVIRSRRNDSSAILSKTFVQIDNLFRATECATEELHANTQRGRSLAEHYLAPFSHLHRSRPDLLLELIRQELSPDDREAARIMTQICLIGIPCHSVDEYRMLAAYKVATSIIVATPGNEELGTFPTTAVPERNNDLAFCIQIMASRLFAPELWKLADC